MDRATIDAALTLIEEHPEPTLFRAQTHSSQTKIDYYEAWWYDVAGDRHLVVRIDPGLPGLDAVLFNTRRHLHIPLQNIRLEFSPDGTTQGGEPIGSGGRHHLEFDDAIREAPAGPIVGLEAALNAALAVPLNVG